MHLHVYADRFRTPPPSTTLNESVGVHTCTYSSCSKSCLGAAALGCVIAELQCPRWLNTLTVEYSAQHFYSQHKPVRGWKKKI